MVVEPLAPVAVTATVAGEGWLASWAKYLRPYDCAFVKK